MRGVVQQLAQRAGFGRDDRHAVGAGGEGIFFRAGDGRSALDGAIQHDLADAGKADACDRCRRALKNGGAFLHGNAHLHEAWITLPKLDLLNLTGWNAGVVDARTLGEAVHRLFEEDVIFHVVALWEARKPEGGDHDRRQQQQCDRAHQHMVGAGFHILSPSVRWLWRRLFPFAGNGRRRGASARAIEIFLNPGVIRREQLIDGADGNDLLIRQHRHAVADRIERVEVMGDEEDGKAQRLLKPARLVVESCCADRV